ncbi:MAG: response regulator transcription factor [Opitutaceae bacterium]|jgi:DNA-binding NarL/FixJ family response regulator
MPTSPLRFIIVHSQRLVAELLEGWLLQQYPKCHVSRYATLSAAFGKNNESPVDVCIFEAGNIRDDWAEFVDEAFYRRIAYKMLILAGDDDDCMLEKLRHAKLDGIVDINAHALCGMLDAICVLLGGGTYISPRYKQALFSQPSKDRLALNTLTETETLILASIGAGHKKHEIAEEMSMAPTTVLLHRKHIMRKLGARHAAELAMHAFRLGLVKASAQGVHRPGFEMALSARNRSRGKAARGRKKKITAL